MKKAVALLALVSMTGCTSVSIPSLGTYKNNMFNKQFSKLELQTTLTGTNGVSTNFVMRIDGWKSEAQQNIEALSNAVNALAATVVKSAVKGAVP